MPKEVNGDTLGRAGVLVENVNDNRAAAEQVKPPTMSRIVAGLERSHLVTITADRDDARRMRITATPKGTRLLTGPDDEAFCRRVSEALDLGYELYGNPAISLDAGRAMVAQAVIWHQVVRYV